MELHGAVDGGRCGLQTCKNIPNVRFISVDKCAGADWNRPLGGRKVSDEVEVSQHFKIRSKKIFRDDIFTSSVDVIPFSSRFNYSGFCIRDFVHTQFTSGKLNNNIFDYDSKKRKFESFRNTTMLIPFESLRAWNEHQISKA